jgi:hypothetical protein
MHLTDKSQMTITRTLTSGEEERARRLEHERARALLVADAWLEGVSGVHVHLNSATGHVEVTIGNWMSDDES